MARLGGALARLISVSGAFVSSLCCVLPVAIVLLGLGWPTAVSPAELAVAHLHIEGMT